VATVREGFGYTPGEANLPRRESRIRSFPTRR
jgi:hypothetical protein